MGLEAQFSADEVRQHCTRGDSWVTVDGNVYDVSEFVDRHPGGGDLLLTHCGGDASDVLRSEASHAHSQAAFSILNGMRIGALRPESQTDGCPPSSHHRSNGSNGGAATSNGLHCRASSPVASACKDELLREGRHSLSGWKEEDLVDWSKPMLCQVGGLGSVYHKWVHAPVDKPLRLFQSDFAEFFSRTPWIVVPIVWLPIIFILSILSTVPQLVVGERLALWLAAESGLPASKFAWLLAVGALTWTFVEYSLHRFLFHMLPPDDSPFLITLHFLLHGQHHKVPFEAMRLVFPPVAGFVLLAIFYFAFGLLFPINVARSILAGGLMGYVCYDLMHYYLHHGVPGHGTYLHSLKSYHVRHHFVDHRSGFGISSKLWDVPFGTSN